MKDLRKLLLAIFFVCLAASRGFCSQENSPHAAFSRANALYKGASYDQAILEYNKIMDGGIISGNLYFNLGNCYFKKGQLGLAVLNYEKARSIMPRDSDLKSNYEHTLSLLGLGPQNYPESPISRNINRLFDGLNVDLLSLLISSAYILLLIIFGVNLYFPALRKGSYWAIVVIVVFIMAAFTAASAKARNFQKGAIVVIAGAQVKYEPSKTATTYFKLGEGSMVWVLEDTDEWYKIKRRDGKIGWVDKASIGLVRL